MRSAADLGRDIGAGRSDPRDLAETLLAAIADHPLGAQIYARAMPGHARAAAAAAADRARSGMRRHPLDGVPVSWKDMFDTAGVATTGGSRLLAGRVPAVDATVVARGAAAGLVPLGKTHMSELAFSGLGVNPMTATAPNIFDPERAPGGSSSGAAASVAFGLAAAAIGSDTGGSVRIPAAWQGLVGLKTTAGVIPLAGCLPLAPSLDTVGPIARSVEDAALLFGILADCPAPDLTGVGLAELTLVVPDGVVFDDCDGPVRLGFDAALARLSPARVGADPVPEFAAALDIAARFSAIVTHEGWRAWGPLIDAHPGVMYPPIEARFRSGATVDAATHAQAQAALARLSATLFDRLGAGFLVMPTAACLAPPVERLLSDTAYYTERNLLALRNTRLCNLLGGCAITLPTATPMVGLMLMAGPGREAPLLRAAAAVAVALEG